MKYFLYTPFLIIVIGLIGVACTATSPTPTVANEFATSLSVIPTTLSTPAHTPTATLPPPSTTPTPPEKPATFTPTPTLEPTSTETPVPIPTPPGTSVTEQVVWLFETNNGCQLPCWWGITPGQTTWITTQEFLVQFDQNIYETSSIPGLIYYGVSMPVPPEIFVVNYIEVGFLVREGVVEEMMSPLATTTLFPLEYFMEYILPSILTTYGKPSQVWLSTYSDAFEEGDLPFILILIYFDQGVLLSFGTNGEMKNGLVQGCFSLEPVSSFQLWHPGLYSTFDQATDGKSIANRDYLPLEEATGMDVTTFYETFKNPDNTVCLETPANLWKP